MSDSPHLPADSANLPERVNLLADSANLSVSKSVGGGICGQIHQICQSAILLEESAGIFTKSASQQIWWGEN